LVQSFLEFSNIGILKDDFEYYASIGIDSESLVSLILFPAACLD
jgi:hypothetical protein